MNEQASANQDCLTISSSGSIAHIMFDNQRRKNAVNLAGWLSLAQTLQRLGSDGKTRVVILSGRGEDFCAGADISEFETVRRDAATARSYESANSAAFSAIRNCAVPVIAAIDGICFGGGFGIAAACDLRIATPQAQFAVPAAKLGLAYPADAMIDIVDAAGSQMARYLTMTAKPIDAAKALRAGFLLEVVERNELVTFVEDIAARIAGNAPLSVLASRLAIASSAAADPALAAAAKRAGDATFDSADYAEGRAAFLERRTPVFIGS